MSIHLGSILEQVIRMERIGISELSRKLKVSRRTIYNWFEQENLNIQIILEVGNLIGYDFSNDLPQSVLNNHRHFLRDEEKPLSSDLEDDTNSVYFWMNKYVTLLEKYNELLNKTSTSRPSTNNFIKRKNGHH
ncbi:MAG: hypothetical protein ACI35V_05780 [Sphingobacterium composti]|uniref:hypothetical protein n=1 Tax=Sphingobacterium composti TaxID=363260 RepID=UPI00135C9F16|nr:hypothetical protein [Sphingobacterium composti Ten et al. 2007 non Yoo et al. 2007]